MLDRMLADARAALAAHDAAPRNPAWEAARQTLAAVVASHEARIRASERARKRTPEQRARARFTARTREGLRP